MKKYKAAEFHVSGLRFIQSLDGWREMECNHNSENIWNERIKPFNNASYWKGKKIKARCSLSSES